MARLFDDASSQYLEKDVAPVTVAPLTFLVRFFSDTNSVRQNLIYLGNKANTTDLWQMRLFETGSAVTFRIGGSGGSTTIVTTTTWSINTWHHACAVDVSSTDHRVFLDGGGKATSSTLRAPSGADRISVGRVGGSSPGQYMSGRICEVLLLDVALTDAEVATHAQLGFLPSWIRPANIKGYWPVWGIHSPEIDLSGQGNSLTLVNGPTRANHAPVTLFTPRGATVPLIEEAGGADVRRHIIPAYMGINA